MGSSPEDRLHPDLDLPKYLNFEQPEIVRLFAVLSVEALQVDHPAHEYFGQRLDRVRDAFRRGLEQWHPEPERTAAQLIAYLDGLQILWLRDPSTPALALWSDCADRLLAT
ncbi:hypothetical protein [Actinokineospora pegani]|uniref:hypothetical protein n=1 Tax=Actinokineospora pegani TaxID=2654637 RepID=UPI0012E9CE6F|nr:hypothetical protein [Actinokineospora pegani]